MDVRSSSQSQVEESARAEGESGQLHYRERVFAEEVVRVRLVPSAPSAANFAADVPDAPSSADPTSSADALHPTSSHERSGGRGDPVEEERVDGVAVEDGVECRFLVVAASLNSIRVYEIGFMDVEYASISYSFLLENTL